MVFRDVDKKALIDNAVKILSKITIIEDGIVFTEDDSIVDWTYEDFRYVPENGFIGHFVERLLDGNLQDVPKEVILENKEINVQIGIVNGTTNETTFYDYGNFIVTTAERDDVSGSISFESADYTKKFNIEYVNNVTYPCLPADILVDACTQVGIDFDSYGDTYYYIPGDNETLPAGKYAIKINNNFYEFTTRAVTKDLSCITVVVEDGLAPVVTHKIVDTENLTVTREVLSYTKVSSSTASVLNVKNTKYLKLVNNDFVIRNNQFDSSDTCRDAVKAVAKLGFTWARIGTDNKLHLDFAQKDKSSVSEYNVITTDDYYNEQNQQELYGPVNCVSLGYSQVEGDDISRVVSSYTEGDKLYEIKVDDNPLWYTDELKVIALHDCDRLFGIEYAVFSTETVGHPWLEGDDLVRLDNLTGDTLYTYPFDRSITYSGFIKGVISSTANSYVQDQLNYDGDVAKNIRKTLFLVDKANQRVEILAQTVEGYDEKIAKIELDNQNISLTVTNVEKGLTNTNNTVSSLQKDVDSVEGSLAGIQDEIDGVSADFEDFKDNEYLQSIDNLQKQIDGAIQFWNGPTIPTLNNYPANQWTTENDRINHQADIYTVIEDVDGELKQGKGYRFDKVNGTWKWIELTDNELSAVQALADEALKKANANAGEITALKKTTTDLSVRDGEISASVEQLNTKFETEVVIAKEASGNPIIVEDAGPYPLQSIHIDGKSYQETRSGKNKLAILPFSNLSINGVTTNFDGETFTIKGTPTSTWYDLSGKYNVDLPIGRYLLSYVESTQTRIVLSTNFEDGTNQGYWLMGNSMVVDITRPVKSISLFTDGQTKDVEINKYIKGLMLEPMASGSTATDFEQYGASPSPDFPSEIKNVEGVTNLLSWNSNLGIGDNNTFNTLSVNCSNIIDTRVNKEFYISGTLYNLINSSCIRVMGTQEYPKSGMTFTRLDNIYNNGVLDYTGYNYVVLFFNADNDSLEQLKNNFQLEEGVIPHDYVPYGNWLQVKTTGKNLYYNAIDRVTTTSHGITLTANKGESGFYLNGTTTSSGAYNIPVTLGEGILLQKGTYTVSCNGMCSDTIANRIYLFVPNPGASTDSEVIINNIYNNTPQTFTINEDKIICVRYIGYKTDVYNNNFINVQIEKGATPTSYEPYKETTALVDMNKRDLFKDGVVRQGRNDSNLATNRVNYISNKFYPKGTTFTIRNNSNLYFGSAIVERQTQDVNLLDDSGWLSKKIYTFTSANDGYLTINMKKSDDSNVTPSEVSLSDFNIYIGTETDDYYRLASIGDIKDTFKDGVLTQRIGKVVLDGSENWVWWGVAGYSKDDLDTNAIYLPKSFFGNAIPNFVNYNVGGVLYAYGMSSHFSYIRNTIWGTNINLIALNSTENNCLQIRLKDELTGITSNNTNAEKLALFKTWLSKNPIELEYILATPIEHALNYEELEMYKGYNNITTNDESEPNMSVTYLTNSKLNAQYVTKSELKVTTDSISTEVSSVTDLTKELGNDIIDINSSLSNYASADRVDTLEQSVKTLQTNSSYSISVVNELKEKGVSKVKTEAGFEFNETGLHITNSESHVGSTLDNKKLLIQDQSTSTSSELLYAGIDDTTNEAIVRSKNLTVHKYLTIGTASRFEPYTDPDYEEAVGVFEV